jgi:glutamate-ammonia-ligase adenylyltransferase
MQTRHPDTSIHLPRASRASDVARCIESLPPELAAALGAPRPRALLEASAGNSPYLARLISKYPALFLRVAQEGAAPMIAEKLLALKALAPELPPAELMQALRIKKSEIALVIALGDICGELPIMAITRALSQLAETAVNLALAHLLRQAEARGEFMPQDATNPATGSGIIILGMGKLGAYELNYSSDIDLIVLFEEDTPLALLEALKPDVLMKGADYAKDKVVGWELVESYGGKVELLPLKAGYSTTGIIKKSAGAA